MDSVLGLIVVVLLIALTAVNDAKKKKKAQQRKPASQPAAPKAAAAAQPRAAAVPKAVHPIVTETTAPGAGIFVPMPKAPAAAQPGLSKLPLEKPPMGQSLLDAEGCIGGSMPDHGHEGESKAEHAGHMVKQSPAPAARTAALRGMTAAQMRSAVVLSEILDRPKALRHSSAVRR